MLTILLKVPLKRSFLGYLFIAGNKAACSYCRKIDSRVRKILVKPLSNQNLFFRNLWGVDLGFG